jgi:hypothetical protein
VRMTVLVPTATLGRTTPLAVHLPTLAHRQLSMVVAAVLAVALLLLLLLLLRWPPLLLLSPWMRPTKSPC